MPATYKPGDLRARKAAKRADKNRNTKVKKDELTSIKVSVPKKLRKAARKRAEKENTTLDLVVTEALQAWLPD